MWGSPLFTATAVVATCLLVAGCGGSAADDIPADAAAKEFCKAADTFSGATKFSDGVKAADELRETGTPKGIPSDARDGFELVVELVTDSDDQADLERRYEKLTAKQKKRIERLDAYIDKQC